MAFFSYRCKYKSIGRKEKGHEPLSPIALLRNLRFIDTGDECESGFFQMDLSGGRLAEGQLLTHCQLMSCDGRIRRPLVFSGGLRNVALQVGYNQDVTDECSADLVSGAPQTKTPRMTARRLERQTRLELASPTLARPRSAISGAFAVLKGTFSRSGMMCRMAGSGNQDRDVHEEGR